ncbi:MAG: DUF4214 domain-containing protein [Clostridiales bacterium]|nr:DUF4214 domain-containing protein [Clostridiales bacterium]
MNSRKTLSAVLIVSILLPVLLFAGTGVRADGTSRDFVQRIYKYVLERESDKDGENYWLSELEAGSVNGGQLATFFLTSKEFTDKNKNDSEFVTILYKTFFGRDPENDGLEFWVGKIENGKLTRDNTIKEFINSQEWADICGEYGIVSGGNKKPSNASSQKPTQKTKDFTERLYTCALERDADKSGLDYWAKQLATYEITGEEAAASFFFSKEMKDSKVSDAVYVYRLYATFMGRVPDLKGFDYWLSVMEKNPNDKYEKAFYGFSRSQEFVQICNEAGIIPYAS